jgi:hypothetical protein
MSDQPEQAVEAPVSYDHPDDLYAGEGILAEDLEDELATPDTQDDEYAQASEQEG